MASGDEAVKIVDAADVADETPLVHVDSFEKSSFFSFLRGPKTEDVDEVVKSKDPKHAPGLQKKENDESSSHHKGEGEHVHEGDGIKTTYDVEEDVPPSVVEQLKRKIHWNGR